MTHHPTPTCGHQVAEYPWTIEVRDPAGLLLGEARANGTVQHIEYWTVEAAGARLRLSTRTEAVHRLLQLVDDAAAAAARPQRAATVGDANARLAQLGDAPYPLPETAGGGQDGNIAGACQLDATRFPSRASHPLPDPADNEDVYSVARDKAAWRSGTRTLCQCPDCGQPIEYVDDPAGIPFWRHLGPDVTVPHGATPVEPRPAGDVPWAATDGDAHGAYPLERTWTGAAMPGQRAACATCGGPVEYQVRPLDAQRYGALAGRGGWRHLAGGES